MYVSKNCLYLAHLPRLARVDDVARHAMHVLKLLPPPCGQSSAVNTVCWSFQTLQAMMIRPCGCQQWRDETRQTRGLPDHIGCRFIIGQGDCD